jgi:hypothetical protein
VDKDETVNHVLGKFEFEELATARTVVETAVEACLAIVELGVESALPKVNAGEQAPPRPKKNRPKEAEGESSDDGEPQCG